MEIKIRNVKSIMYLGGIYLKSGERDKEIASRIRKYGMAVKMMYQIIGDRWMEKYVKKICVPVPILQ